MLTNLHNSDSTIPSAQLPIPVIPVTADSSKVPFRFENTRGGKSATIGQKFKKMFNYRSRGTNTFVTCRWIIVLYCTDALYESWFLEGEVFSGEPPPTRREIRAFEIGLALACRSLVTGALILAEGLEPR